jgi:flagellar assembly factor FliW
MEITTSRFGTIRIDTDSVIRFPSGLLGLEDCREWVLLADGENSVVVWLQSVDWPEVALALVSPRRFVRDYQVHVARRELAPLELSDVKAAEVLAIVGKNDRATTLNLKAPVVINVERGLGYQVIANGDLPVQYELESEQPAIRRIAETGWVSAQCDQGRSHRCLSYPGSVMKAS